MACDTGIKPAPQIWSPRKMTRSVRLVALSRNAETDEPSLAAGTRFQREIDNG